MENLFKIFQNRFPSVFLFYTPWDIANNQMFPGCFQGVMGTLAWNELNTKLQRKLVKYLSIGSMWWEICHGEKWQDIKKIMKKEANNELNNKAKFRKTIGRYLNLYHAAGFFLYHLKISVKWADFGSYKNRCSVFMQARKVGIHFIVNNVVKKKRARTKLVTPLPNPPVNKILYCKREVN